MLAGMSTSAHAAPHSDWFRRLLDTADDVYFRFSLTPSRRFVYVSPSVRTLTGHEPSAFIDDPTLCLGLLARDDRRRLRQILRAQRGITAMFRMVRDGATIPVSIRTIAVVRSRRVIAVEGVVRRVASVAGRTNVGTPDHHQESEPATPQRLAALMFEVHSLLHRVMPEQVAVAGSPREVVRIGDLELDLDRFTVTEGGGRSRPPGARRWCCAISSPAQAASSVARNC